MTRMDAAALAAARTPLADKSVPESDVMELDAQTLQDLEVFESGLEGASLFEFCNRTRSRNGALALKERMRRPWSNPERIRSVQKSLVFMQQHREVFDRLPSYITIQIVDRYKHGTLPPIMSVNRWDFGLGVIDLLYTDTRRYDIITQGVAVSVDLIHTLREMVQTPEFESLAGCELAEIIAEMRALLAHEKLADLTNKKTSSLSAWKILRTDQILRLHEKDAITRLLQLTFELDALLSMSDVTKEFGFIMPQIEEGPLSIHAEGLKHPMVENAVANPVTLDQQRRLMFLTGPNMAGKTTYLRACAVALYFAHLGMGVAASSFSFVPAQKLFSSISLSDDLHAGVSFFRAEGLRVKAIAQALSEGYRVIALMDEPFKGTNVKDALDASSAILQRFAAINNCLFMFSSHLIELSENFSNDKQVDCRFFEARENEGRLSFEYILHKGVSSQRLGMRVLEEEGIFDLLDKLNA